jgi:hypothetical protein
MAVELETGDTVGFCHRHAEIYYKRLFYGYKDKSPKGSEDTTR